MNLGGIGRGSEPKSMPEVVKPVADVAQKAAKAGKIRSIKLKIKMKANG